MALYDLNMNRWKWSNARKACLAQVDALRLLLEKSGVVYECFADYTRFEVDGQRYDVCPLVTEGKLVYSINRKIALDVNGKSASGSTVYVGTAEDVLEVCGLRAKS